MKCAIYIHRHARIDNEEELVSNSVLSIHVNAALDEANYYYYQSLDIICVTHQSREEKSNDVPLKLVPCCLFLIPICEFDISNNLRERLWFPWELLSIRIICDNGTSVFSDHFSSLSINKDQSWYGCHFELGGEFTLYGNNYYY